MRICFINSGSSLLPEIDAYVSFFSTFNDVKIQIANSNTNISADVEWHFMGIHRKRSKAVTIHEYASSSVPPFGRLKNNIKKAINCKPDYRLFFSEFVHEKFAFDDNIPFGFRDHGINEEQIITDISSAKKFDFIYIGSVDKSRMLYSLFQCFSTGILKDRTLLILTKDYEKVAKQLEGYKNITFAGPIPYTKVYDFILQSRFAINFMPDVLPYNKQVSSKFIDYIACKTPVISSEYFWIKNFERQYGGRYFYLEKDLKNFTWENVNNFKYDWPILKGFSWKEKIIQSGVIDFLRTKFPKSFVAKELIESY